MKTIPLKKKPRRSLQRASLVREILSDCLAKKTNDTNLHQVIITQVDLSPDARQAVVYFTTMQGDVSKLLKVLDRASGFLRCHLASGLCMAGTPALQFKPIKTV